MPMRTDGSKKFRAKIQARENINTLKSRKEASKTQTPNIDRNAIARRLKSER